MNIMRTYLLEKVISVTPDILLDAYNTAYEIPPETPIIIPDRLCKALTMCIEDDYTNLWEWNIYDTWTCYYRNSEQMFILTEGTVLTDYTANAILRWIRDNMNGKDIQLPVRISCTEYRTT